MNTTKVARKLRERIGRFSGDVSARLGLVVQRLVGGMLDGIQAAQSGMLTKVGRMLEEPIPPKKALERLGRFISACTRPRRRILSAKTKRFCGWWIRCARTPSRACG